MSLRAATCSRHRNPTGRLNCQLFPTDKGRDLMMGIRAAAREHEKSITAALTSDERQDLLKRLQKIAAEQGLSPGIHPGYRRLQTAAHRPARHMRPHTPLIGKAMRKPQTRTYGQSAGTTGTRERTLSPDPLASVPDSAANKLPKNSGNHSWAGVRRG
jgi:hypothetical protein